MASNEESFFSSGLKALRTSLVNLINGGPEVIDDPYELPIVRKAIPDPHKKFFDLFNGFSGEARRSRAPGFHRIVEGKALPGTEVLIRYPYDRADLHIWLNAAMTHMRDHWGSAAKFMQGVDKHGHLVEDDRDLRVWVRAYAEEYGVRIVFAQDDFTPHEVEEAAKRRRFISDGGLCP